MSNQNYDQVTDLLVNGQLRWELDPIAAVLVRNSEFTSSDKRLSDTGAGIIASTGIQGRWIAEGGMAMGLPAAFQRAAADQEYQVIVVKDDGRNDPIVLAFLDEDAEGNPIIVTRSGTLIVRPSQENLPVPPATMEPPPTTGFWMSL